jgi:hypothetical protein
MQLSTIEIPRVGARERAAEYSRVARHTADPVRRHEFEEIARCYRLAARDDVALIDLDRTFAEGGTTVRTRVIDKDTPRERRENYLLPRLAACRSSADYVYCLGVTATGACVFSDSLHRREDYRSGVIRVEGLDERPSGFADNWAAERVWTQWHAWSAMVPIVPPEHQPRAGGRLNAYVTLFEVEDWQWRVPPRPPGDPALLRHVGGSIYAVLAVWDLTELEQLVLSGRRPQ